MKSNILALTLLLAIGGAASAEEKRVVWQGEIMVTGVSPGCAASKDKVGDNYLSIFQPENNATITINTALNYLSFYGRRSAFSVRFSNLANGAPHNAIKIGGHGGQSLAAKGILTNISVSPPTVTATTPTLVIDATVTNWFVQQGCTATIRGAYVRRVDGP